MIVRSLPMKNRKRLADDVIETFVPHVPDYFMKSKTQNAREKIAEFTDMFCRLSNIDFLTNYRQQIN